MSECIPKAQILSSQRKMGILASSAFVALELSSDTTLKVSDNSFVSNATTLVVSEGNTLVVSDAVPLIGGYTCVPGFSGSLTGTSKAKARASSTAVRRHIVHFVEEKTD